MNTLALRICIGAAGLVSGWVLPALFPDGSNHSPEVAGALKSSGDEIRITQNTARDNPRLDGMTDPASKLLERLKRSGSIQKALRSDIISRLALTFGGLSELINDPQALEVLNANEIRRIMRLGCFGIEQVAIADPNKRLEVERMLFRELADSNPGQAAELLVSNPAYSENPALVQEVASNYHSQGGDFLQILNRIPENARYAATLASIPAFLASGETELITDILEQLKSSPALASGIVEECIVLRPYYDLDEKFMSAIIGQIESETIRLDFMHRIKN